MLRKMAKKWLYGGFAQGSFAGYFPDSRLLLRRARFFRKTRGWTFRCKSAQHRVVFTEAVSRLRVLAVAGLGFRGLGV